MSSTAPRSPLQALFAFVVVTVVATWLLLVIGGTVNPTGSSLACPDWYFVPTCYGEVLPDDWGGGILYEHGHRMWASLVGLLTVGLAIWVWRRRELDLTTRRLGVGAVVLVAAQGTLGGITVKLGLNWWVSTLHLVTAMVFFCLLILIGARIRSADRPERPPADPLPRAAIAFAIVLVVLQVAYGGLVRHKGAGLVCGNDWWTCGREGFWPALDLAQLHMGHRFVGYLTGFVVFFTTARLARAARSAGRPELVRWAFLPVALVVVQIALGLLTVATGRSVGIVALHTAVAGGLLAALVVVYLLAGPLFSGSARRDPSAVGAPP